MQENIIGYLLGALDDDEMAQFEAELDRNEDLQRRVQDAARSLQVLDCDHQDEDPPAGLVEATCRQISSDRAQPKYTPRGADTWNRELAYHDGSWSLFDLTVAASFLFLGCLLFLPAVNSSRMHSQIAGCQDNLRFVGRALIEYSMLHPRGFFPEIPRSRHTGVAGSYAAKLISHGLVTEEYRFHCPTVTQFECDRDIRIPTLAQMSAAEGLQLRYLQQQVGGDYASPLGCFVKGKLCGIRNANREHFVLMADSPACALQPTHRRLAHRNVLFECGSVRLIPLNQQEWNGDRFFEDDYGRVQAGVDHSDSVLAPSETRPLPDLGNAEVF